MTISPPRQRTMHRLECGVKTDQVVRIGSMAADIVVAQRCNYKAAVKLSSSPPFSLCYQLSLYPAYMQKNNMI